MNIGKTRDEDRMSYRRKSWQEKLADKKGFSENTEIREEVPFLQRGSKMGAKVARNTQCRTIKILSP